MKKSAKQILTFLTVIWLLAAQLPSALAASTMYSGIYDREKGIADYGSTWVYECKPIEGENKTWQPMISEGYKQYGPLPYDLTIFKGVHALYPSKIVACGRIHAIMEDVAITFIAPQAGNATISQSTVDRWLGEDSNDTGDGVQIYILHNDKQIWPAEGMQLVDKALPKPNTFDVPEIKNIQVKKGDKIRFCVNRGAENEWCDDLQWDPIVFIDDGKTEPTTTAAPATSATTQLTEESTTVASSPATQASSQITGAQTTKAQADTPIVQDGAPVGLIVGIVAGVVVLVGAGIGIWFYLKKKSMPKES